MTPTERPCPGWDLPGAMSRTRTKMTPNQQGMHCWGFDCPGMHVQLSALVIPGARGEKDSGTPASRPRCWGDSLARGRAAVPGAHGSLCTELCPPE